MLTEKIWGLFGYDFRNRPLNCIFRALVLFCSCLSTKCSTMLTLKGMCWFYKCYWEYVLKADLSFVLVTNLFGGGCWFSYNSFHTVEAWLQSMADYLGDSHRQTGKVSHVCGNMPGAPKESNVVSGTERLQGPKLLYKTCLCLAHLEKTGLRICSSFIENIISSIIYLCNTSCILKMLQGIS